MKIQFVTPKVEEGKRYKGEISRYTLDEKQGVCRVYVVLDREPNLEFMKRFEYNLTIGSDFFQFCDEIWIYDEDDGTAELGCIKGTRVIVKLKKGKSEKFYVQEIKLDEKYYNEKYSKQEQEEQDEE